MQKALLSVIVPVYNAERYIKNCVKSIQNQEYSNIEIILVNDGSTDNSKVICEEMALHDNRIKLISKKNAGPSAARQDALLMASGEFIAFVDADDYIHKDMYRVMIKEMEEDISVVQCGYKEVDLHESVISENLPDERIIIGEEASIFYYLQDEKSTNFLWDKIYRAELFKGIIFPELYYGEDSCVLTQIFYKTSKVKLLPMSFYNYVMAPESLCRQPFNIKKIDNIKAGEFKFNFLESNRPHLAGFAAMEICSYASKFYFEVEGVEIKGKDNILKSLVNVFDEYFPKTKSNLVRKHSTRRRKIFINIFKVNKMLARYIFKKSN